ncbi:cytochrome P450 [Mycobacterium nebraskense]|uniref:Cytochrome n=1 Tax=Mycobacterium nebraskense TaxID=244292 RepID=A0A0F5NGJ0_9MYCO|nr:cytochrome P450 [Mycobacterium nebraskense]KKC06037.1 cytochrome P450 [Mycobacterium nebraskense]KLO41678.1 cytochrome P450 [Mycobacterium nebraskense]MBI2695173.1 cytochrome P450 [Mycobacterium nebraskense]MCV7115734.1 cytochrome P450 [Mycobacterium nebraskense]ORW33498.1 cytochrome [Mycobacterium nebraskense]
MSISFETSDSWPDAELPVLPVPRPGHCPLAPPPEFAEWREQPGLRRAMFQGNPVWVVSRYHDIRAALVDPRLSAKTIPDSMMPTDADNKVPVMFARADDPEHQRLRRMMTSNFTFRRCESMRPHIQEMVDHYLGQMVCNGAPADLVREFALPVPSMVIALLLGVPPDDLEIFQYNTTRGLDQRCTDEERGQAFGAMYAYIQELVQRKEREPGDDLISRLVTEYVATGQLDHATTAMNSVIMMQAGHETTANMISLGTVALLEHPDVFERLGRTDDPAVIANVVEELMRYLSIVHSQVDRVATEDLMIGGQLVRAGEYVMMSLLAGNWDAEFVDNPESFDVGRNTRGHLGFGYGVHQCIGANLARVEMQVAFATLARRLPGLKLAVPPEELRFKEANIYGMKELPVSW